ncbi:hypothetical protein I4U23_007300 [Adineta vaga]|nr:hypothetical protein I4U23_007300 [Adineta vaga]
MLSMSRFVHTSYFMSSSDDSDCYISPGLSSSTMTMSLSRKQYKKRAKKRKSYKRTIKHMDTTRRCQVKLLDDKKLELSVNSKQTVTELINEISRQYHLTETEYFGVYYEENDERMWLPSDKKLLDQEVFKRDTSSPTLYFAVRFVFKSFLWLQNATTVMLFFLSTRYAIYQGIIDTNDNTLFQLAGLVIQAIVGDYTNDEAASNIIKRVCILPKRVIERNTSRKYCEDQIINHYKACREIARGLCIVKYMMLAENLPSYGSHYFLVRNKNNVLAYLGISFIGISVYSYHDRETPLKIYYWRQLENLYYRDRKFSLEVHDLENPNFASSNPMSSNPSAPETDDKLIDAIHDPTTQMSTSRRIPPTPNIKVRAWFTNSPQYCKAIWSMAVSQHQFYLDKRNCRQNQSLQITDLVRELNNSTITLTLDNTMPNGTLSRSNSVSTNVVQNEQIEADVEQLMDLMKTRKQQLESLLDEKMKDFGLICVLENQVTGATSDEHIDINDSGIQQELKYHVVDELLNEQVQEVSKLNQLKHEHEIQSKIVLCAKKLLHDQAKGNSNLLDSVLKQRFEFYTCVKEKLDRLTKSIDVVQKEINARYPYADTSPVKSSTATSGSPPPNSYTQRYQQRKKSPSPTQLNRTSSYKRALVNNQRTVPSNAPDNHSSEFDNQVFLPPTLDRSQSSDRLVSNLPPESSNARPQHTAYILQPPSSTNISNNTTSRNRIRDRKHQSSLRHIQKSTSTSNTLLDDQSQQQQQQQQQQQMSTSSSSAHMRSLDRRHGRALPHNSSSNTTISKTHSKSSHTDIYGSLERNKHSKVSQPALHGTILNDENDRLNKTDHQAHDFYHLTPTLPSQSNTTSTIVNVGNVLQQQQQQQQQQQTSFDHIDSIPPSLPPSNRTRRPPPSVFQPPYDSSTLATTATTLSPKDTYYTISGSKDVSTHPHTHIRGLVADNFYSGPYASKPPVVPPQQQQQQQPQQQQQSMQRYDTSPLLVRRLEHMYPSQTRYQPQPYSRTQSGSVMTTSQTPSGRLSTPNQNPPSTLLFRPHSSQSSSSQSSGPNSGSLHVAEEFTDDVLGWLNNNHACGFLVPKKSGPEWNSLRTTWGPNPFSSHYYVKQPLTIEDAKKDGFEQISTGCQGKFLGQRFIQGKDVSLVLIYDSKGFIAGTQMAIPASLINEKYYKFSEQKMFNRDTIAGIDVYILTAYFVDPKTICQSDENSNLRKKGSIGTGLWLQNGTDPIQNSFSIPLDQSDADQTKWVQGACFPSMGKNSEYPLQKSKIIILIMKIFFRCSLLV